MRPEDYAAGLFAGLNPVPDPNALEIVEDLRSDEPVPVEKTSHDLDPLVQRTPGHQPRAGWLVGLAVGVLVLAVGIVPAVLLLRGGGEAAANMRIVENLHEAMLRGDWRGLQSTYAPEATFRWVGPGQIVEGSMSDIGSHYPSTFASHDWDRDGVHDTLDLLTSSEMMQYANGRTEIGPCRSVSTNEVICEQRAGGTFWRDGNGPYSGTWSYEIANGQIVHLSFEIAAGDSGAVRRRAAEFRDWLEDNHPDQVDNLFIPGGSQSAAWLRPDNLETFRELVSEWEDSADETG